MAFNDTDDRLARLVSRALREPPTRRAPAELIERVLRELERRRARPWWHRTFGSWPVAAQLAFFVTSIGCAALLWLCGSASPLVRGAGPLAQPRALVQDAPLLLLLARLPGELASRLHRGWVYEGMLVALALYALLFALLATAYVLLWNRGSASVGQRAEHGA